MDWISFSWGVGFIIFVNIIYTIWAYPKQLKEITELTKDVHTQTKQITELEEKLASLIKETGEGMTSLDKTRDKVVLALETLESSTKLRKTCPACGHEFPLYIMEET